MDFFARQDHARKRTGLLIFYFSLAVSLTILLVYFLPVAGYYMYLSSAAPRVEISFDWWNPDIFMLVCGITLAVVLGGAFAKIAQLRHGGGSAVAEMLGGRQIRPETSDFFEKRLRNIVEEVAIAAGMPVPPVYVLEREPGINAFAAGFSPSSAVVAVTCGAMTGLTRDELQGVIAHEFSHIFNNDMRININLMGVLHGLLIIGLTGRIILRFAGRGSEGRRGKDSGQAALILFAAGLCLMIVGFTGLFFCRLIKASISRSREQLADASAVQFTRNPGGLAGALKKIGGLSDGSILNSPQAEEASHMFFGNGLSRSLFNTHPPLTERIRWLDPSFNGRFDPVTLEDLQQQLIRFEGAPVKKKEAPPQKKFVTPERIITAAAVLQNTAQPQFGSANPDALIASIGVPTEQHTAAARQLIDSIPETVKEFARDPYGARMMIYFLLLDSGEALRARQMALIAQQAEPEIIQALEKAVSMIGSIRPDMRLPIIDLAIPALRFLSKNQYFAFRMIVKALIEIDEKVDVFEYALQRVLIHHLDPVFGGKPKQWPSNYYAIRGLEEKTSVVLSVLVRKGHPDESSAAAAFHAATSRIPGPNSGFQLLEEARCTWNDLDAALDKLNEGSFLVKKWVLAAALACLMHDREITVEETELFRAIADTLGCPVPPWVVPVRQAGCSNSTGGKNPA
ncbi:MAG: M48 family metallopeptidase [Pontiellaceae bacterium]|jgi:Zn-dependent protease with chaperone function|nr:M48 family metallopeptidase [Pontiellaceae bacterium]